MKREIKFRGYDTEKKRMFEVFGIGKDFITENTLDGVDPGVNAFDGSDYTVRIEVMQFTGLKDKNGKEIYEGDIVRILYNDWPSNSDSSLSLEDYLISISYIGYIEYNTASFSVMIKNRYDEYSTNNIHVGKHGRIEIIGNIHENPELLKS